MKHFDTFVTYSKAAGFVEDWIRTKKNNPTDFATDFPAVVNRGVLVRKILLHLRKDKEPRRDKQGYILDPEVKGVNQMIFTRELYPSQYDYIVYFTCQLIEQASMRQAIPVLCIRVAINHIAFMVRSRELQLTEEHKNFAMDKLKNVRPEVIHDYVKAFKLTVNDKYFENLTKMYLEQGRYVDACTCIVKFNFFDQFDLLKLCVQLIEINKIP